MAMGHLWEAISSWGRYGGWFQRPFMASALAEAAVKATDEAHGYRVAAGGCEWAN